MANTKIVIIGGVAGGATAAARARRLSEAAEIIVFERGPHVSFANCGLPYHIGGEISRRDNLLLQTPESLWARHRIDVRVRTEVTEINRSEKYVEAKNLETGDVVRESYDKMIISTGASAIKPPIPGIDLDRIMTLRNVPDMDRIKAAVDSGAARALVVGGGFIGLEVAENLVRRGVEVDLIEMAEQVMPPLDQEMATPIHQELRRNGVRLHLGDGVTTFRESRLGIEAELAGGKKLHGDIVILAIGIKPESTLARNAAIACNERGAIRVDSRMVTNDPDVFAVGDVVEVTDVVTGTPTMIPLAGPANRQARIAADNILGRESHYRGTQGTSVVRVFDLTIGSTGASEKTLERLQLPFRKVYLHPAHHVGYFPGAETMHMKLLYNGEDGRVLGTQVVGRDGVDRRVDVIAMAIQARMTVFDLEEVELAYAPQFGAAKDPVNMAGFIAANDMRGDVSTVHADALDGSFLLDVREPAEFEAGSIPGAALIPLHSLREKFEALPKDKPIVAFCKVGMRGYLASRVLRQAGFDVSNLSGGYTTYKMFHAPDNMPSSPEPSSLPTAARANQSRRADHEQTHDGQPNTGQANGGESNGGQAVSNRTSGEGVRTHLAGVESVTSSASSSNQRRTNTNGDIGEVSMSNGDVLDARGLQCPGPIVRVSQALAKAGDGQAITVLATDPGFPADIPAWCRTTGNELVDVNQDGGTFRATIRKRCADARLADSRHVEQVGAGHSVTSCDAAALEASAATRGLRNGQTIVVFSHDLDKVLAAFVIANGAASLGKSVTLFFTFWGLNVLRRSGAQAKGKSTMDRMFGWMMPKGPDALQISKMRMGGVGTAMIKKVMRDKNVESLPALIHMAQDQGVRLVACAMSMDIMGIRKEELVEGVEFGGVGAYLAEADQASSNLFI